MMQFFNCVFFIDLINGAAAVRQASAKERER